MPYHEFAMYVHIGINTVVIPIGKRRDFDIKKLNPKHATILCWKEDHEDTTPINMSPLVINSDTIDSETNARHIKGCVKFFDSNNDADKEVVELGFYVILAPSSIALYNNPEDEEGAVRTKHGMYSIDAITLSE